MPENGLQLFFLDGCVRVAFNHQKAIAACRLNSGHVGIRMNVLWFGLTVLFSHSDTSLRKIDALQRKALESEDQYQYCERASNETEKSWGREGKGG